MIIGRTLRPPEPGELSLGSVTGSYGFVLDHATPYEQDVLAAMLSQLRRQHRWVEWKIRCVDLKKGDCTCPVPGWHFDTVQTYHAAGRPEVHHIFVTPPPTLFAVAQGQPLGVYPEAIPPYTIVSYGREMHRPDYYQGTAPLRRLLIRASETDYVHPRNVCEGR